MKADARTNGTLSGNLIGRQVDFTVDDTAMDHVMSMFTDLYSDPIMAVVREYSTNARDAQIEAGFPGAIEVKLPSTLSPFFVVRDYGTGLDEAGIARYYAQYGASTKRDSDLFNGMLGVGCKSALTYTNQFTVESVKDGVKTVVAITRDEKGRGGMTVMPATKTDEANGTTVQVPVKSADADAFRDRAANLYRFWDEDSVTINGKPPEHHGGLKLTNDLYLTSDGQSYAVIGNVGYPLETHRVQGLGDLRYGNLGIIAYIPMTDFRVRPFTPSRESLDYRSETLSVLNTIAPKFQAALSGAIQREVDAAGTPWEAVQIVAEWDNKLRRMHGTGQYKYKGKDVPRSYCHQGQIQTRWGQNHPRPIEVTPNTSHHGSLSRVDKRDSVSSAEWSQVVWVEGWDLIKLSAQHKRKLRQYIETKTSMTLDDVSRYYMIPPSESIPAHWIDPSRVIQWAEVQKEKLPQTQTTAGRYGMPGRPTGSYDCYIDRESNFAHTQADQIDTSKPIIYVNGNRYKGRYYMSALAAIHPGGFTLACLPANRVDKFKRTFPSAKGARVAIEAARDAWWAKVPADTKIALAMHDHGGLDDLKRLDAAKVDDPDVKKAIRLAKIDLKNVLESRKLYRNIAGLPTNVKWENPLEKYPLYAGFSGYGINKHMQHVYLYINAAYEADN